MSPRRVAAVDCGTNSIRLLIAEVGADGRLVDVVREMRIIRLGEGVDATGRISAAAIERAREALVDYCRQMAEAGVTAVRMVATSATRDASNREEFFAMTAELLGAVVPGAVAEVISGETEAELTFAGGVSDLDPAGGPVVVTDLGGGSTELVVGEVGSGEVGAGEIGPGEVGRAGNGTRRHGSGGENIRESRAPAALLLGARSVDIGCVRLTERILHSDPPTAAELAEARGTIDRALAQTEDVPVERARRWVGVAGTFTTLSALAQRLDAYDAERIHGSVVPAARLREVCAELVGDTVAERLALGPVHEGRADVIGGGSLVAAALCDLMERRAGLTELVISEKDILDGIALSIAR